MFIRNRIRQPPLPCGLRRKCGMREHPHACAFCRSSAPEQLFQRTVDNHLAVVRTASSYLPEPMPVSAKMP